MARNLTYFADLRDFNDADKFPQYEENHDHDGSHDLSRFV